MPGFIFDTELNCSFKKSRTSSPSRLHQLRLLPTFIQPPPFTPCQILEYLLTSRRPGDLDTACPIRCAQPHEQTPLAGREVTAAAVEEPHLFHTARFYLDPRSDCIAVALLAIADQLQAQPGMFGSRAVAQQGGGTAVMTEGQIGQTIVIVVRPGQAAADDFGAEVGSGLVRDITKAARGDAEEELRFLSERSAAV